MIISQGRYPNRVALIIILAALFGLWATTALAGAGGRETGRAATHIHAQVYSLAANKAHTIETTSLSAGADSVLYVWDQTFGTLIASNDDYSGTVRSLVTIPSSPLARSALIVVRAYGATSGGTATLKITPSSGTASSWAISFTAGYAKIFAASALPNATNFRTVEEQGGTGDTILVVTCGASTNATAIDNDSGPVYMSFVSAPKCTSTTTVYVGSVSSPAANGTTLVWDEDILKVGGDTDGDGLGNGLEAALGTNPNKKDTDGDGISDYNEVYGMDWWGAGALGNQKLTRLPYFGADPKKKDVFIQADWIKCDEGPLVCGINNDPDRWRIKGPVAKKVADIYAVAGVYLHIDTEKVNTDPSTRTIWGAWGGAARRQDDSFPFCSPIGPRGGTFHGARIRYESGGGAGRWCFQAGSEDARNIAHELGHNVCLGHGPIPPDANFMPNYRSLMNYAMTPAWNQMNPPMTPKFSTNEFANAPLNPTSVSETAGLNTTNPAMLAHLSTSIFDFTVWPDGAVDWNQDGIKSASNVRAAVAWGDVGAFGQSRVENEGQGSALAWLRGNGPIITLARPKLHWFTRKLANPNANKPIFRTYTKPAIAIPGGDGLNPFNWVPAISESATLVPNALAMSSEPAAVHYTDSAGTNRLFLFYTVGNVLYSQSTDGTTWTSPSSRGPGVGDPAAVNHNGKVYVFVRNPTNSRLLSYVYSPVPIGMWSLSGVEQTWSTGASVQISQGIGVTSGYLHKTDKPAPELTLVALIPRTVPTGQIEVAIYDEQNAYWSEQPNTFWRDSAKPNTDARPSIAYVPFALSVHPVGRFYVAWKKPGVEGRYMIGFTEGNDNQTGALVRRFTNTKRAVDIWESWRGGIGSVSLINDLDFDDNLRVAWGFRLGTTKVADFTRFGDQILNTVLKDWNDHTVIAGGLAASLQDDITMCPWYP